MKMKFDTKVIHAAIKPDSDTGSIVTPMHQTATYVMEKVGKDKGYDYTRSANPTREIMEDHGKHIEESWNNHGQFMTSQRKLVEQSSTNHRNIIEQSFTNH